MTSSEEGVFPVYCDGRVVPAGTAVLPGDDAGFLHGLSVFETLLVEEGHAYFLDDHLARLRCGAETLGIPWPPPCDPAEGIARLDAELVLSRATFRVTLSRGSSGGEPRLVVAARPVSPVPPEGVRVHVASHQMLAGDPLATLKSTNRLRYVLAREEAERAGAWEALLANQIGDLAEGTVSNVFLVTREGLLTPDVESGCLPGILRGKVLAEIEAAPLASPGDDPVPTRVGPVPVETLARACEVFLTNATGGVVPVAGVVGAGGTPRELPDLPGAAGPVTRQVVARVQAARNRDRNARNPAPGRP